MNQQEPMENRIADFAIQSMKANMRDSAMKDVDWGMTWLEIQEAARSAIQESAAEIRRQAWFEVADLCDRADKSTHPADLADTIRTLAQSEQEKSC